MTYSVLCTDILTSSRLRVRCLIEIVGDAAPFFEYAERFVSGFPFEFSPWRTETAQISDGVSRNTICALSAPIWTSWAQRVSDTPSGKPPVLDNAMPILPSVLRVSFTHTVEMILAFGPRGKQEPMQSSSTTLTK